MKLRKSATIGLLVLFGGVLFSIWYLRTYSMGVATEYEVNNPSLAKHLLIVTQQSAYKDSLTAGIVSELRDWPVYIKVLDLTTAAVYPAGSRVDACILMHTWEMWRPPGMVTSFLNGLDGGVPLLVVTTSGAGDELLEEAVDGISSASEIVDVPRDIQRAVLWARYALGFVPAEIRHPSDFPKELLTGPVRSARDSEKINPPDG